ncbi:MAG: hypothetical protein R3E55_02200 [Burkholderiaceae bacterium]
MYAAPSSQNAFNDTQLVAHLPIFEDAQLDPSAHQVQYRAELWRARSTSPGATTSQHSMGISGE